MNTKPSLEKTESGAAAIETSLSNDALDEVAGGGWIADGMNALSIMVVENASLLGTDISAVQVESMKRENAKFEKKATENLLSPVINSTPPKIP